MALVIRFYRVPRYWNIITKEYETVPFKDIALINKYFDWQKEKADNGKYSCDTLKEWCGVPESELPHKYVISHYSDFYTRKPWYLEYTGERSEVYSIFEDVGRFVKTNQIMNWLINNVTEGKFDHDVHEISEEQVKNLSVALGKTCRAICVKGDEFVVKDEAKAKENLPVMDELPYFWGSNSYDSIYAEQVADARDVIERIRLKTDFEKESIYYQAMDLG